MNVIFIIKSLILIIKREIYKDKLYFNYNSTPSTEY